MADTINPPVKLTGGVALADIGGVVPVNKVRSIDLRATNVVTANAYADVFLIDTNNSANNHYRCRNYPVPYLQTGSAPDLEYGLLLTAGWKMQVRSSVANAIDFSYTAVEDDA